jgi:hypothetical protein
MERSNTIGELAKGLVKFQSKMQTVVFDANNPFFKSKYATLAQLVSKSKDLLASCGLAVSQLTEDDGAVSTILMHESGEFLSSKLKLTPAKNDPQGLGSAITYARRYAYASILGLVADDDDDGNVATFGKAGKNGHTEEPIIPADIKPQSQKDKILMIAKTKFADQDKFKAWRVENNLVEDLDKASTTDLNYIEAVMREYKPVNRVAGK